MRGVRLRDLGKANGRGGRAALAAEWFRLQFALALPLALKRGGTSDQYRKPAPPMQNTLRKLL